MTMMYITIVKMYMFTKMTCITSAVTYRFVVEMYISVAVMYRSVAILTSSRAKKPVAAADLSNSTGAL